jgi:hypothetical protein
MMKALLYYWDKEQQPLAREALAKAGRADLIGNAAHCLVPREERHRKVGRPGRPPV